jgi:hypothetical protein
MHVWRLERRRLQQVCVCPCLDPHGMDNYLTMHMPLESHATACADPSVIILT